LLETWHPMSVRSTSTAGASWPLLLLMKKLRLASAELLRDSVERATVRAITRYRPTPYAGSLLHVIADGRTVPDGTVDTRHKWTKQLADAGSEMLFIPAPDSEQLLVSPYVEQLVTPVERYIAAALAAARS
jgi:hypothetical protein